MHRDAGKDTVPKHDSLNDELAGQEKEQLMETVRLLSDKLDTLQTELQQSQEIYRLRVRLLKLAAIIAFAYCGGGFVTVLRTHDIVFSMGMAGVLPLLLIPVLELCMYKNKEVLALTYTNPVRRKILMVLPVPVWFGCLHAVAAYLLPYLA